MTVDYWVSLAWSILGTITLHALLEVHQVMLDFEHFSPKGHNAGQHSTNQSLSEIYSHSNVSTSTSLNHFLSLTLLPRDGAPILEARNSWSRYVHTCRDELTEGSSLDRESEAEGSLLPAVNTNTAHLSLDAQRQRLPIFKHRQKLLWCVEKYRVVIVVGQTGCGKSTREPRFICD